MHTNTQALPSIIKTQQFILVLLYRFRFLNRYHLQTFLNHKDYHRINIWLKDLTEKEYIGRIWSNKLKVNTLPAKYYLKIHGVRYLKTRPECYKEYFNKLYKEDEKSNVFIEQCLFIADLYLQLLKELKKHKAADEFQFYTQSDYDSDSTIRAINSHFVIREQKGNQKKYDVYHVFEDHEPQFHLKSTIKQYIHFFENEGKKLTTHITFICPERKYESIQRFIKRFHKARIRNSNDF